MGMGETEDGQTWVIPTPGNANAPTIVKGDFNQNFGAGSSATNINCTEPGSCLWILEQTEDGQTVLIPASNVNLDADLGSGTNTVIVDADSLSSTHGRTGSSYHGNSVKVDSKFLNKLLSQSYGGRTRQSGNY